MKTVRLFAIRNLFAAAAVTLAAFAAGCSDEGPSLYPVTGTVTFDGQPVKEGRITFRMAGPNGRAYAGDIRDGTYEVKSEAGSATVEITASRLIPGKFDRSNGTPEPVGEMYIPKKYNTETKLAVEIKHERNEIPFDLLK